MLENYSADMETGEATGNVLAYRLVNTTGKSSSLAQIQETVNLALKAGFGRCIIGTDPLALDLDGDGLEMVRQSNSTVYFDLDKDNFAEHTAWVRAEAINTSLTYH